MSGNIKRNKEEITVKDLQEAEKEVIKHVQGMKYEEEIERLKTESAVKKNSSIRCLLPVMNEEGIICVGGRLDNMEDEVFQKHKESRDQSNRKKATCHPFYVKQGRAEVKRYGCIYTCMNMRAVHIEKLNSLETDSFINSFRRFTARRGIPKKVWSDNGTNFVGASPELMKCLQNIDEEKIKKMGLKNEVEWKFNTPHASHMGGVWERQIRTIRKVLAVLLQKYQDKLTDEVLETLFAEIESIINSRPLTKVSEDATDMSTLSPNQLLILNEMPNDFPGKFHYGDAYKQRWRFVQHLANQFWKRWTKQYIPELQRRQKWIQKIDNVKIGETSKVVISIKKRSQQRS